MVPMINLGASILVQNNILSFLLLFPKKSIHQEYFLVKMIFAICQGDTSWMTFGIRFAHLLVTSARLVPKSSHTQVPSVSSSLPATHHRDVLVAPSTATIAYKQFHFLRLKCLYWKVQLLHYYPCINLLTIAHIRNYPYLSPDLGCVMF